MKNQYNLAKTQGTALAQSVDPTPAGQSMAQKSISPVERNMQVMGLNEPMATTPTNSERMWADRQQRAMTNPVMNILMGQKYKPLQVKDIDGVSDETNAMIRNIVGLKNAYAQNAYNQSNRNMLMRMLDREARVYNQDTSNRQSGLNTMMSAYARGDNGQMDERDILALQEKRSKIFDTVISGVDGFDALDPTDQDHVNLMNRIKARYASTGELPISFKREQDGWFGERIVPIYGNSNSEGAATQQQDDDSGTLTADDLQKMGIRVRNLDINY